MRVDQLISQSTTHSRKDVKQLVRQKRVRINNTLCNTSNIKVSEDDAITVDGNRIEWPHDVYYMLNKPAGYCCSHEDDGAISAIKLLPNTVQKLHFAGRLDTDTTGLVLLSSNGDWCHRITSPKQRSEKRKEKHYRVELAQTLSVQDIKTLETGIMLRNEKTATLPAVITHIESSTYTISISEGRYHQVKRMFAAVNNHVKHLHRFQIADIQLDEQLSAGEYRQLTPTEIDQFTHDT
jgi:16S rRNA pseudouridine516 synthase